MDEKVHCEHADRCAGCPQIERAYDAQLAFKTKRVLDAFVRYPALRHVEVAPTLGTDTRVGYRTRSKLIAGGGAALGLFSKSGDHSVVDIPNCLVMSDAIRAAVACVRKWLMTDAPPSLRATADGGRLTALDVREAQSVDQAKLLLTLILTQPATLNDTEREAIAGLHKRIPSLASVAASFVAPKSIQVLGRDLDVVVGEVAVPDQIGHGPLYQLATHGSFVQAHRGTTAKIHAYVLASLRQALGDLSGLRVIDFFAGSGAFGLELAYAGADALLVESYAPAMERAKEVAAMQGLPHVFVFAGDASQVAKDLASADAHVDAVVVNPPRRGVDRSARAAISSLRPKAIAYVSCHPETLARDAADFARMGYRSENAHPFDMIPLTDEVETVVIFVRTKPSPARVLYANDELVAIDKDPNEPTTPQGEYSQSLLDRVRALPGCADAVPLHRLDEGTSGVCLFATHARHVAAWSNALSADDSEKMYVALVRGVCRERGRITKTLTDEKKEREASTRYAREAILQHHSLLHVFPAEGRTHQVRRHLASIGHPVLGDARYGDAPSNRHLLERHGLERTFLHCARIELQAPARNHRVRIESPLAGDLASVVASLGAAI